MKHHAPGAAALAAVLVLVGCGTDDETNTSGGATSTSGGNAGGGGSGDGGASPGGAGPIGGDRPVEVFVPKSYSADKPAPLVLLLHGYTASGSLQELYFQLQPLAEEKGFLYAHPDGTKDAQNNQFWNATDACCDFGGTDVDDSAYLEQVIHDIEAKYSVDPKRIFLAGHSNGGFMSYRMACDHADTIAAIASLAGAMFVNLASCKPSEPVSVLQIHGTADDTVPYDGGALGGIGTMIPSAKTSVEDWAGFDGCATTSTAGTPLDLALNADATTSSSMELPGAETQVAIYDSGCKPGGHAELWSIQGGNHVPGLSPSFSPKLIEFLLAHPKP